MKSIFRIFVGTVVLNLAFASLACINAARIGSVYTVLNPKDFLKNESAPESFQHGDVVAVIPGVDVSGDVLKIGTTVLRHDLRAREFEAYDYYFLNNPAVGGGAGERSVVIAGIKKPIVQQVLTRSRGGCVTDTRGK